MGNIKRKHPTPFKVKVALELIRGAESASVICSRYSIHPTQAGIWKDRALKTIAAGFDNKSAAAGLRQKDELIDELYRQIGQLKVELDWLKKNMGVAETRTPGVH